eukprot:234161_1
METIKWTINDAVKMKKLVSTKPGETIMIKDIIKIYNIGFQIYANPNESTKSRKGGMFMIYIELLDTPQRYKAVIATCCIECKELIAKQTSMVRFHKLGHFYTWKEGMLSLSEIKKSKLNTLTFIITIRILKTEPNQILLLNKSKRNYSIETQYNTSHLTTSKIIWHMEKDFIKTIKKSNENKSFESPLSEDGLWCIIWHGRFKMQLCSLPDTVRKIDMTFHIECKELNFIGLPNHKFFDVFNRLAVYRYDNNPDPLPITKHTNKNLTIIIKIYVRKITYENIMKNQPQKIDDAWNGNAYNAQVTNMVVYGFIRLFQRILGVNYNFDDISMICLSYVGPKSFFKNNGVFKWILNDKNVMNKLILPREKFTEKFSFESKLFLINNLQWIIGVNVHNAKIQPYVELLFFPVNWKKIIACVTLKCIETGEQETNIISIEQNMKNMQFGWSNCALSSKEIIDQKLHTLSFIGSVSILDILSGIVNYGRITSLYRVTLNNYAMKQVLKWKIKDFNKMIKGKTDTCFEYNQNVLWCLQVGLRNNDVFIAVQINSLPGKVESFKIKFKLSCAETKRVHYTVFKDTYVSYEKPCMTVYKDVLNLMESTGEITIVADIDITHEFDKDGADLTTQKAVETWNKTENHCTTNTVIWRIDSNELYNLNNEHHSSVTMFVSARNWKHHSDIKCDDYTSVSDIFDIDGLKWMICINCISRQIYLVLLTMGWKWEHISVAMEIECDKLLKCKPLVTLLINKSQIYEYNYV